MPLASAPSLAQPRQLADIPSRWADVNWRVRLACFFLAVVLSGCSTWNSPKNEGGFKLGQPQMSPDSVVLEVVILHLPEDGGDEPWWSGLDEQALDHALRLRLAENGFRAGIVRGRIPEQLESQLGSQRESQAGIDPENQPAGVAGEQRLQCRAGKRNKILLSDVYPTLAALVPNGERLTGRTLENAQCLLSVRSFPRGDGGVELEITPEIEHGQARQRWVGQAHEGTYRLDSNRERLSLESLRIRPTLEPGQVLAVSCAPEIKGLGRQFFSDIPGGSAPERRVLLIRLAQTQIDDLFSEQGGRDPLTTSLD
ncbi:MAG: hypothetical protein U0939_00175 [Pirellulales bacterium]